MTVFDPNRAEDLEKYEAGFWDVLASTLVLVFAADPELAVQYRLDLAKSPPLQRALALHDDPLDLAATLTGTSLTADRIALYDALRKLHLTSSSLLGFVRKRANRYKQEDKITARQRERRMLASRVLSASLWKWVVSMVVQLLRRIG
jgi:hypothetical protein